MVIVGILAGIGVVHTRGLALQAYETTLKADLKLLATHQELFEKQNYRYASLGELTNYEASEGVTMTVPWVDRQGFVALAIHAGLPDITCGYYVGDPPDGAAGPATAEATILCD